MIQNTLKSRTVIKPFNCALILSGYTVHWTIVTIDTRMQMTQLALERVETQTPGSALRPAKTSMTPVAKLYQYPDILPGILEFTGLQSWE